MRRFAWLACAALSAGCVSKALDSHVDTPAMVRLEPPDIVRTEASLPAAIAVARPRASSSLATDRIAVRQPQLGFDYFAGVRWSEPAPEMLQRLLVAAIADSGRFAAVFAAPARLPADYLLDFELRRFEAVYPASGAAPTVVVDAQVSVVRGGSRVVSFVAVESEPAADNRRSEIVAAFDRATARVIGLTVARLGEIPADAAASGGKP